MPEIWPPEWLDSAHWYYSRIDDGSGRGVNIYAADDAKELNAESPGRLCLRLEPGARQIRVLDANRQQDGAIHREGFVPGLRYTMRRNGKPVWVLSVRSIVRKRYSLRTADNEVWTFETPFFWWQQLFGTLGGAPRLVGGVGPTTWFWLLWFEPGRDTVDVLAAVAFLHRLWWRW